jgi:hypothetical protein
MDRSQGPLDLKCAREPYSIAVAISTEEKWQGSRELRFLGRGSLCGVDCK